MALFQSIPQLVASLRPSFPIPHGTVVAPSLGKKKFEEGYAKMGEGFGKGLGEALDPEIKKQQAMQTRDLIMKMPSELQKSVYSNPDVQSKLRQYYRWSPELFADAGMVTNDEAMKGQLAFVGDVSVTQALEKGAAQTKQTEAETGLRKAQTIGQEQENTLASRLQDIKVALDTGQLDVLRTKIVEAEEAIKTQRVQRAGMVQKQQFEVREQPLQEATMRAQARSLSAGATLHEEQAKVVQKGLDLKEQQLELGFDRLRAAQKEDPVTKRLLDTAQQYRQSIYKEYGQEIQFRKPEFATRLASMVNANVINSFGATPIKTADGSTVYLPAVLQNATGTGMVNNAMDTIYSAVSDRQTKMDPQKLESLYLSAKQLYDGTFRKLENSPKLNEADQAAMSAYLDPRMKAKMAFIQYIYEKKNGVKDRSGNVRPLTKQEETEYKAKIQEYGGLPSVVDETSWWQSIFSGGAVDTEVDYNQGS